MARIGIGALAGAIFGFVYELVTTQGHIETPHKPAAGETVSGGYATPEHTYDLGVLARVFVGIGAGALGSLLATTQVVTEIIAIASLAGFGGPTFFETIQSRINLFQANTQLDALRGAASVANEKINAATEQLDNVNSTLRAAGESPAGTSMLNLAGTQIDTHQLTEIERLLSEARGILSSKVG